MARKAPTRKPKAPPPPTYWYLSRQPLASLGMLLPLIVAYEVGVVLVSGTHQDVLARKYMMDFMQWFGVTTRVLPGVVVVVLLLIMHIARGEKAQVTSGMCLTMGLEAVAWSAPLFVLMLVLRQELWALAPAGGNSALHSLAATTASGLPWYAELVFSVGAGIYEELLFRMFAIAFLHYVLVDYLALPEVWGTAATVAASSIAFALYHFDFTATHGAGAFNFPTFVCLTLGGAYLAMVYLVRGFGIAAGTHAMYDILVVLLRALVGA